MTSNAFDRVVFNVREKPLSADWNRVQTQHDYALRLLLRELYSTRAETTTPGPLPSSTPSSGFVGLGMSVVPAASPNLTVTLKAGMGFVDVVSDVPVSINGIVSLDDVVPYKPLVLTQDVVLGVPTPPGANGRIDLVEVRPNRRVTDPQTRLILDPSTGAFNPDTVLKTMQFTLDGSVGFVSDPSPSTAAVGYKQGAVSATPVAPTPTPGYVAVAYVHVNAGNVSIPRAQISDRRRLLFPGGTCAWSGRWRVQWNGGSPIVTARRISAPPGIQVTCVGQPIQRGMADFYVVGGQLQSCPMTVSVGVDNLAPANVAAGELISTVMDKNGSNDGGAEWGSSNQATALTGTPPIDAGPASMFAYLRASARYQAAGATNVTNVLLEDLVFDVAGVCRW